MRENIKTEVNTKHTQSDAYAYIHNTHTVHVHIYLYIYTVHTIFTCKNMNQSNLDKCKSWSSQVKSVCL